jgi:hypothetical protein
VELIKEIGAFAGLAAFMGLAILALLYFSQARDLRRLRDWAGRAPERDAEGVETTSALAAERAEELRKLEEERRSKEEAQRGESQAAEKRERRRQRREAGLPEETRLERIQSRFSGIGGGRLPEPRYLAVVIGGVIVLGAAVAVGVLGVFGGGNDGNGAKDGKLSPGQVTVSVLNGTAVQGLAARVGDKVESDGFQLGAITNSRNTFTESIVMFSRGHKPEARRVAKNLRIPMVRLMTPDIRDVSGGSTVSVVVGEDNAGFGTSG